MSVQKTIKHCNTAHHKWFFQIKRIVKIPFVND